MLYTRKEAAAPWPMTILVVGSPQFEGEGVLQSAVMKFIQELRWLE
jgi:hypothetical protein